MPSRMQPEYLGDSVYIEETELGDLLICTNNGLGKKNSIYLEPAVVCRLNKFIKEYINAHAPRSSTSGIITDLKRL